MNYWKYRAYDALLRIQEGVIQASSLEDTMLQLRQQGLQGVELDPIDQTEYRRALYLQKLKERLSPKKAAREPVRRGFFSKLFSFLHQSH